MSNGIFKLGWSDLAKGLVMAVLSALLPYLANLTTLTSFSTSQIESIVVFAVISYLAKNLVSTTDGKVAGVIG